MTRRAESRSSPCSSVAGSSKARVMPAAIWRWKSPSFFAALVAKAGFGCWLVLVTAIWRGRMWRALFAASDRALENDLRPALAETGKEGDGCVEVDGRLPLRQVADLEQVALQGEVEDEREDRADEGPEAAQAADRFSPHLVVEAKAPRGGHAGHDTYDGAESAHCQDGEEILRPRLVGMECMRRPEDE